MVSCRQRPIWTPIRVCAQRANFGRDSRLHYLVPRTQFAIFRSRGAFNDDRTRSADGALCAARFGRWLYTLGLFKTFVLTNPYITAIVVPLLLILCSAVAKKLVRGSTWQRSDFFLGVELSLAAMAAGLVNFLDLTKPALTNAAQLSPQKTTETAVFVAICFFLLLWILSTHQDWEKRTQNTKGQIIWLGVISNFVGAGLMVAFILYVKGL